MSIFPYGQAWAVGVLIHNPACSVPQMEVYAVCRTRFDAGLVLRWLNGADVRLPAYTFKQLDDPNVGWSTTLHVDDNPPPKEVSE